MTIAETIRFLHREYETATLEEISMAVMRPFPAIRSCLPSGFRIRDRREYGWRVIRDKPPVDLALVKIMRKRIEERNKAEVAA
jgi:hypothetical protein